jgi:hypothetical protein
LEAEPVMEMDDDEQALTPGLEADRYRSSLL